MTHFYGIAADRARSYVGSAEQLARIESLVEAEGAARGARRLRLITGGGLEVELHPDRALDIGQVTVDGMPVAWMESEGIPHPWAVDPHGDEWLRAFGGGLLTTCGLDTFGGPTIDEGVSYGQHGRISGTPARMTRTEVTDGALHVEGFIRQSRLNGENLLLHRRITAPAGQRRLLLHDTVINESTEAAAHMIMYHFNVGWPMIDEHAQFFVPSSRVVPREDGVSADGIARWREFEAPTAGRREEVFVHHFDAEPSPTVVTLRNERRDLSLSLTFDRRELPWLDQWKLLREGTYVLGIEPVNSPTTAGRAGARSEGTLPFLAPGERAEYHLELAFANA